MAAPKKPGKTAGPTATFRSRSRTSHKGIHAKTKQSKNKASRNYVKVSRGQG